MDDKRKFYELDLESRLDVNMLFGGDMMSCHHHFCDGFRDTRNILNISSSLDECLMKAKEN